MSKKDVLHIPPTAVPPAPDRSAGHEGEGHVPHVPPMHPSEGPGGTPGRSGNPRIITPQPPHDPYPGTHVT
jgi:hypothetical protein